MRVETFDDVWVVGGARSAFGRFGGSLRDVTLVELGQQVIRGTLEALDWPKERLNELNVGTGMIEGGLMVPARQLALAADLPETLPTLTVDRACCSGATTVGLGARAISRGEESVLCLGIESMSRTPRLVHATRWDSRIGSLEVEDLLLLESPVSGKAIAEYVGQVALEHGVGREDQDRWAVRSHAHYADAAASGFFKGEIAPVATPTGTFVVDEHPRPETTLETLAELPTVRNSPTITAGNAPGLNDGAAAIILSGESAAREQGHEPLARVVAYLQTAESPTSSAYLPGLAIERLLDHRRMRPIDVEVLEINEAYAATPLVSVRRMAGNDSALEKALLNRTNVNGGAVALGHPIGASGARLVLTAARQLRDSETRWAAVAICGGFGQTDALLLENVHG